jgi:hypothetical protein
VSDKTVDCRAPPAIVEETQFLSRRELAILFSHPCTQPSSVPHQGLVARPSYPSSFEGVIFDPQQVVDPKATIGAYKILAI